MYSVEDLLISHGYKLPRSGPPSTTPYDKRPPDLLHSDPRAGCYGSRQALVRSYPAAEGMGPGVLQRRKELGFSHLGDPQPLGDSLATDSGFYDVPSLTYSEPLSHEDRDVSYWRRRGQDFSILLDYADGRELRASAGAWRPQALLTPEEHRAERHAQQLWEDISWLRDLDTPGQLRVTGERKCQSLGTEEWRPAVGLDRHRLRTPDGSFHPRTKAKSQSLPRVLSPEGARRTELVASRPSLPDRQRVSSTVFSGPYSRYVYSGAASRERWGRSAWPGSHVALLPKPRFSRPLKPPSYEIHQQTRGSAEMLAIEQGAKQKDRPIYFPRGGELQRQDYFAQHSAIFGIDPPGYIPPPSYRRAPPQRAVPILNRNEVANLRWRSEALQMASSDAGRWLSRQAGSWLEHYGDRGVPYRKQIRSGYEEQPSQARYLPIEDQRLRQISGGPGGNTLTDSDKIRSINKEIPCAKVVGQSNTHDSAFPPPLGPAPSTDSSNRWSNRGINKGSDSLAPEQSRSQFFPSSILGKPPPPPCKPPDQAAPEVKEEVKKPEPPSLPPPDPPDKDKTKNLKKKLSETIFCLVSVPVTPQPSGTSRDQNNNDEKPPDVVDSPSENKTGHLTNQSLQSTSSAEAELQALTGSMASSKASSRASSKLVKRLPCRPPKINHYKELKLSGSWPANQYRDQVTQTSPEARKPAAPGPENKEAQVEPTPPGADAPADGGGVVNTAFSFPITGVKSLKLSSNSAFSLTSTFSNHLNKSTSATPCVEEAKPAAGSGQEAFGQFLLKPAPQRPWDTVKDTEANNKELKDQQQQSSKQPSVDKCIEDLNEAYKDILELGTASNKVPNGSVQIPERIKIRLTSEPLNKPSSLRRSAVSWSVDPDYRDVKSAFSRPATKSVTFSKQLREEKPVPPRETGFREYRVVSHLSRRRSSDGRTVKLDLPDEPIEMPLSDFGPSTSTAAAEVPWADRQPMQDASTLTSPPDYEDICQALRQSRDPTDAAKASAGGSRTGDAEPPRDPAADSPEECPICKRELENQLRQGPLPPLHEENSSDSSTNQNGSPPQCPASESPAEDAAVAEPLRSSPSPPGSDQRPSTREQHSATTQDHLECAGDSECAPPADRKPLSPHEPTERQLGQTSVGTDPQAPPDPQAPAVLQAPADPQVPPDPQAPADLQVPPDPQATSDPQASADPQVPGQHGVRQSGSQDAESDAATADAPEREGDLALSGSRQEREKKPSTVLELSQSPRVLLRSHLGRDHTSLPEFPPDRLPLSVPPIPDRRLSLSLEGERRGPRASSARIETLQDKLAALEPIRTSVEPNRASVEPNRVAIERPLPRMREVDAVYRMRRLSIRSTDSGEAETEEEGEGGKEKPSGPPKQQSPADDTQQVPRETVLKDSEATLQ